MEEITIGLVKEYGIYTVVLIALMLMVWRLTNKIMEISTNHLTHIQDLTSKGLEVSNNILAELKEIRLDLKDIKRK
jgi:hypothetical protein